jgi:hypothetical protein
LPISGVPIPARSLRFLLIVSAVLTTGCLTTQAQSPAITDTWHHLSALPPGTRLHISSDKKSRTCFFASADDQSLICSRKRSSGTHYTFARSEVRTVKLTRYTLSTVAGMGIGAGAGLGIGAAVGQAASPKTDSSFDFSGIGRDVITGIGGVVGFIAGGAIGGPADFLRGPTLYRRPGL